jgi:hypothetical protein
LTLVTGGREEFCFLFMWRCVLAPLRLAYSTPEACFLQHTSQGGGTETLGRTGVPPIRPVGHLLPAGPFESQRKSIAGRRTGGGHCECMNEHSLAKASDEAQPGGSSLKALRTPEGAEECRRVVLKNV